MNSHITKYILLRSLILNVFSLPSPLSACDTWIALTNAARIGFTILAKNSDRSLFDCRPLIFYPHRTWPEGENKCCSC